LEHLFSIGILHRDISTGNIMCDWRGGRFWVVLNDFDLAGKTPNDSNSNTSRHRTGTLPFMSLELLIRRELTHRLRHDLESLFYVAVWWAVKTTAAKADRDKILASWNRGSMSNVAVAKKVFLSSSWKEYGIVFPRGFKKMVPGLTKLKAIFNSVNLTLRRMHDEEGAEAEDPFADDDDALSRMKAQQRFAKVFQLRGTKFHDGAEGIAVANNGPSDLGTLSATVAAPVESTTSSRSILKFDNIETLDGLITPAVFRNVLNQMPRRMVMDG